MLQEVVKRLTTRFNPETIASFVAAKIPDVISALLVLFIFWLLWLAIERGLRLLKSRIDITLAAFITTVTKMVLLVIAIISALGELGINTGSLLASLGVAGLTLGFAAKDTLSNVISGVFIFWDRPFVLGDLIEIDGKYGRVDSITLRSTRVITPDGKMLAIPNSTIVNTTVASYTNFPNLRLDIDVTLGVEEDLARARQLVLDMIEQDDQGRYLESIPPRMVVTALNDYNVQVQYRVWLKNEKDHILERAALRERIFLLLREAKVEMPYQTFVVHQPMSQTTPNAEPVATK